MIEQASGKYLSNFQTQITKHVDDKQAKNQTKIRRYRPQEDMRSDQEVSAAQQDQMKIFDRNPSLSRTYPSTVPPFPLPSEDSPRPEQKMQTQR